MEYEVIDVQLIDEDLDPYHEVLRGHQGKPYYVPDKKELLAYDNPFYWENTPEAEAFRTFLLTKTTVPEDKMEAVFVDIYYGLHCMNAGLEDVLNRLDEIGVEFRRKVDVGDFAEVYTPFHNHVRMQYNRGHTPDELTAMYPPEERIPKSISFGPNIRQAIADGTMNPDELRQGILAMEMPSEELRMNFLKEIAEIQNGTKPKKGWPERSLPLRKREEIQKVLRTVMRMKIKLQTVIDAIEQASDAYTMLYDTKTNETVYLPDVWITGETDEDLAELIEKEPERFLRFPTKYEIHEYSIMDSFVDYLPPGRMEKTNSAQRSGAGVHSGASSRPSASTASSSCGTTIRRMPTGSWQSAGAGTTMWSTNKLEAVSRAEKRFRMKNILIIQWGAADPTEILPSWWNTLPVVRKKRGIP